MEDRETPRIRKYGESKTTRIMMATVPTSIPVRDLENFRPIDFYSTECTMVWMGHGKQTVTNIGTIFLQLALKDEVVGPTAITKLRTVSLTARTVGCCAWRSPCNRHSSEPRSASPTPYLHTHGTEIHSYWQYPSCNIGLKLVLNFIRNDTNTDLAPNL